MSSTETLNDASPTPSPTPAGTETRPDKLMRQFYEVLLAGKAQMLARSERQQGLLNRLARKTMDGTLGQPNEADDAGADDMQLRIGDETINYYGSPPEAPANTPTATKATGWASVLKQAALGAALVAAGGGMATALSAWFPDAPTTPVVQPAPAMTDTDTISTLEIDHP